jgi:23S rRNA pseudouridine2605 synthase
MQRIQKLLAHHGVGSRREVDLWLQQGRIKVNGRVAKPGDQINGSEKVSLDDKPIRLGRHQIRPKVLMYHKPIGRVCSRSDPDGRPDVFAQLPKLQQGRWIGIGRLDINTSGLLLFTNHGELANRMMHPSFELEREYAVRVRGEITADTLLSLQQGIELEDGPAAFEQVVDGGGQGSNHWYHVVLREGRNREVRRLWEAVGAEVSRLVRVRYHTFTLPKWLKPGKSRFLEDDRVSQLFSALELEYPEKSPYKKTFGSRPGKGQRGRR